MFKGSVNGWSKRLLALSLVVSVLVFSNVNPTNAQAPIDLDFVAAQETDWGVEGEGISNVVGVTNSLTFSVEEVNSKIYAAGKFTNVTNGDTSFVQPFLAAFDVNSGEWVSTFTPDIEQPVLELQASPDGALFIGGEIKTLNGSNVGSFSKIDPETGEIWPGWDTRVFGGGSYVREISLEDDGWLYVAGRFSTANDGSGPIAVNDIVRLDPITGVIDETWLPDLVNLTNIRGVSASKTQNTVYIVGKGTTQHNGVVGISSVDPTVIVWDSFENNYVKPNMWDVLATEHGTVFVAGEQHALYVYDENNSMALKQHHISTPLSGDRDGGDYQDLELEGDTVFASCHCWGKHYTSTELLWYSDAGWGEDAYTGTTSGVVAYDASTGLRNQDFNPYMSGDIGGWDSLRASDGCLWLAGGYNSVGIPGSTRSGRDLVRLCSPEGGIINPPASCVAIVDHPDVEISWDDVPGISDFVIYRTVDAGQQYHRGSVSDANTFTDSNRLDTNLTYYVASKVGVDKSETVECSSETIEPEIVAPTQCQAVINGSDINISWDYVVDADRYIIRRSLDGGTQQHRGSFTGLSAVDSNRDGFEIQYFVESVFPGDIKSDRTACDMSEIELTVDEVASCLVTQDPADPNSVVISWPAVDSPDPRYVIKRSVDGGTIFWSGAVDVDTTFAHSLRAGSIQYYVQVKANGLQSELIACGPVVQGV